MTVGKKDIDNLSGTPRIEAWRLYCLISRHEAFQHMGKFSLVQKCVQVEFLLGSRVRPTYNMWELTQPYAGAIFG